MKAKLPTKCRKNVQKRSTGSSNLPEVAGFLSHSTPPFQKFSELIIYACQYDKNAYRVEHFTSADICFPEKLKNAVPKRQSEYFAGRLMAKKCLMELGFGAYQVLSDSYRCPVWPDGIKGAVSHTNTIATCVVTTGRDIKGVGMDAEHLISTETLNEIRTKIVDANEWQLMMNYFIDQPELIFTTVFSAKESIFKALYPAVKTFFDFSAVKLQTIDIAESTLCFELKEFLSREYSVGQKLKAFFEIRDDTVYTLCLT